MTAFPSSARRVLITGGAGFIGSNWARYLLEETDARVHVLDNLTRAGVHRNLNFLRELPEAAGRLRVTAGDVRNAALVEEAVAGADEVYHLAAQTAVTTSVADPRLDMEVNLGGAFNILEAVRKAAHRPFLLFTSTNKVYGAMPAAQTDSGVNESQPLDFHSPYGCSKGAADQYVRDYARIFGVRSVVFRMSCIAGRQQFGNEDQGWLAHFLYSALEDRTITLYGDGCQVRDVLNVNDLLEAFAAAARTRESLAGNVYNIGGGPDHALSLLDAIESIAHITGRQPRLRLEPARPGDQKIYVTDFSRFRRDTGWKPRLSVEKTLSEIHAWWRQYLAPPTTSSSSSTSVPISFGEAPQAV